LERFGTFDFVIMGIPIWGLGSNIVLTKLGDTIFILNYKGNIKIIIYKYYVIHIIYLKLNNLPKYLIIIIFKYNY
jgi:hypothetical protein